MSPALAPAKARDRLDKPRVDGPEKKGKPAIADVDLHRATLRGETLDQKIIDAVIGGQVERTIEGASTVTLDLHDPDWELLNGKLFRRAEALDFKLDRFWFRLVGISVSDPGDTLTLTFEDREVAWLRGYDSKLSALRDKATRAEFIKRMVDEVEEGKIRFISPGLHKAQPIAAGEKVKDQTMPSTEEVDDAKGAGLSSSAKLTVKGQPASAEQIRNAETILRVGTSLNAPPLALLAAMCAAIGESEIKTNAFNPTGSAASGVFQLIPSTAASLGLDPQDVAATAERFFTKGYYRYGGAIALANKGGLSPGTIASQVEGSDAGGSFYDEYAAEARAFVEAFGGGDLGELESGGSTSSTVVERYRFTRGTTDGPEDSWACIGRLAEEVAWRAFMSEGTLYYMSDFDLLRQRPRLSVTRKTEGVLGIGFDFIYGRNAAEAQIRCRAKRWQVDPGMVVTLEDCGAASGNWLVKSVVRPIFSREVTVNLAKPMPPKPEPAPETHGDIGADPGGDSTGVDGGSVGGSVVDQMIAEADRIDALRSNYVYGGGHVTPAPASPPWDCSSSVSRLLQHAGFDIPTMVSGALANSFESGPGREVTIYANSGHVLISLRGRFWGTSSENPGGGPGWIGSRDAGYLSSFTQRHPRGL